MFLTAHVIKPFYCIPPVQYSNAYLGIASIMQIFRSEEKDYFPCIKDLFQPGQGW